jgi:DNA adenine methylase
MRDASPLRYPGGKWRFTNLFERLISSNFDVPPVYVEPYAGGASLALSLLFSGAVSSVRLNDLDPAIHAFWFSVIHKTDEFAALIRETPVTPHQWLEQRRLYSRGKAIGPLGLGFALFFLNRTNHSGILNGGMIGGKSQSGEWKLDARFNRDELIRRVHRIAAYKDQIQISCRDALDFIDEQPPREKRFVYFDPPYYGAGRHLYLNAYRPSDHEAVRNRIRSLRSPWVVSYDNVPAIRKLYRDFRSRKISLMHTARDARKGTEIVYFSPRMTIPRKTSVSS